MMYANSFSKALAMSTLLCSDTILAGRVMRDFVASRAQRRRLPVNPAAFGYEGSFDKETEHLVLQNNGKFAPESIIDTYRDMNAQAPNGKYYAKDQPSYEEVMQADLSFKKICKDEVDRNSGNRGRNGKWQINTPKPKMVQVLQPDGTMALKKQADSDNAIGNLRGRVGWFNGCTLGISAASLTVATFFTHYNVSMGWSLFLFIAFAVSLTFGSMRVFGFNMGTAAAATIAAGLFTAGAAHGGLVSKMVEGVDFNTHGSMNFGLIGAGLVIAFVLVIVCNWRSILSMANFCPRAGPKQI